MALSNTAVHKKRRYIMWTYNTNVLYHYGVLDSIVFDYDDKYRYSRSYNL